ncbi:MAG: hypothetical protein HC895_09185 [Leptolyngbyaceae cyanobacterium SM1_3_5]|nr:hypothetical protein [Leptolyngbyaceae cyanobacterium SM1_3_5]
MTDVEQLNKLAEQLLNDPILLRQLSDRVYQLMAEELRNQRDRSGYGRRI